MKKIEFSSEDQAQDFINEGISKYGDMFTEKILSGEYSEEENPLAAILDLYRYHLFVNMKNVYIEHYNKILAVDEYLNK